MHLAPGRSIPPGALGRWAPLSITQVADLMRPAPFLWWIVGGWAIDLHLARQTRAHEDVEVAVLRRDADALRRHLRGWDVWYVPEPGEGLRGWEEGAQLPAEVHEIWARRRDGGPWELEILLEESDGELWIYRRDGRIMRELTEYGLRVNGVPVVRPEIALLYKSKATREHDRADFASVLPLLSTDARLWLANALELTGTGADWIDLLRSK